MNEVQKKAIKDYLHNYDERIVFLKGQLEWSIKHQQEYQQELVETEKERQQLIEGLE